MDRRALGSGGAGAAVQLLLCVSAMAFVIAPVALTVVGAFGGRAEPGGFGLPVSALLRLTANTLLMSVGGALTGLIVATTASAWAMFNPPFRRFYTAWLLAMLFTNPVFMVLGLSTLFAGLPPLLATATATAVIVLPLGGLIVQSAFDEFPELQVAAARGLGASRLFVLRRHILPFASPQLSVAGLLMTIYAMGFYLLPAYVGLGRTPTLATAMNTLIAQQGAWPAADQMAIVLMGIEALILAAWVVVSRTGRLRERWR
jgi:ABC-type spermidine/putrescine transport system permease subunit I